MTTQGSEGPTLSVVIPSRHRLERLRALIDAYLHQGADEVIVVLDGPHPGWSTILGPAAGDRRVRVIEGSEHLGLALARIEGLNAASGEVVLAVDDDIEPDAALVERHRAFHVAGGQRVLLGYAPVVLPPRRRRADALAFLYARDYEQQAVAWRRGGSDSILGSLWGGNISLPRELYCRVEAEMPSIPLAYHEDLDLGLRLARAGATADFDEQATGRHHHTRDIEQFRRECIARGHSIAALEARWGERPRQLDPLVAPRSGYGGPLGWLERRIAAGPGTGMAERLAVAAYRAGGMLHAWPVQDRVARFLRRALVSRSYRLARERG